MRGCLSTVRAQIHHQEGEIVGDVERAQARVELDAIHDRQLRRHDDVLGAQVTVDLANQPAPPSGVQRRLVGRDEGSQEPAQRRDPVQHRGIRAGVQ